MVQVKQWQRGWLWPLALIWLTVLLRLWWASDPRYSIDITFFMSWMRIAARDGIWQLFDVAGSSYPPLAMYWLWGLGRLAGSAALDSGAAATVVEVAILRYAIIVGDVLMVAGLLTIGRRVAGRRAALGAGLLYALCPGGVYLSGWWLQIDAWVILPMVLACWWLARGRLWWAGIAFGVALGIKLQVVVLLPLLIAGTWRWHGWRKLAPAALGCGLTLLVIVAPVAAGGRVPALIARMTQPMQQHQFITMNSYSLWYTVTPDARYLAPRDHDAARDQNALWPGLSYHTAGFLLLAIAYALILTRIFIRSHPHEIFAASAAVWFAAFMLATRTHIRYVYPLCALLLCAGFYMRRRWWWGMAFVISLTLWLNLVHKSQDIAPIGDWILVPDWMGVLGAWIHVVVFAVFVWGLGSSDCLTQRAPFRANQAERALVWSAWGVLAIGVVGMLWQSATLARETAALEAPLAASLEAALETEQAAHTVIVNWPGIILAAREQTAWLGVVPVTPPALFLTTPNYIRAPLTWVQYAPWRAPIPWQVEYYGPDLLQVQLHERMTAAQRVIAFSPESRRMYPVIAAQPYTDGACRVYFGAAPEVCLGEPEARWEGDALWLTLPWRVIESLPAEVTVFVHLLDANGALAAQADGDLLRNEWPLASRVDPTRMWRDTRILSLPPGEYPLHVGLYHRATGERWPAHCSDAAHCTPDASLWHITP